MTNKKAAKDFYRILRVSRTATVSEIKQSYRRLALELHPDRHDGCDIKSSQFKDASEAYSTLIDHTKRTAYDDELNQMRGTPYHYRRQTVNQHPTPNYRKVYAPRPPPGFKIFDHDKHFEYHYGERFMEDEIDRAKKRAAEAGSRSGFAYESPLGKGFTFGEETAGGGGTWKKGGKRREKTNGLEYEYAYYVDPQEEMMKRVQNSKDVIRERMKERRESRMREDRIRERKREEEEKGVDLNGFHAKFGIKEKEEKSCTIM